MMSYVLVVDDKDLLRDSIGTTLERAGFRVESASEGEAALALVARQRPDAIVTDMRMPGLDGIGLLERVRAIDEDLPVVVMTAFGTIETAVQAMKLGAFDYLTKPFEGDELIIAVKRAIAHGKLLRENAVLRAAASVPATPTMGSSSSVGGRASRDASSQAGTSETSEEAALTRLIGASPAMQSLKNQLRAYCSTVGTVLVAGESGVGKEVIARAIHEASPRRERPFLAVNCAALSESLLESELFGHEKGAFTGAERLRKGRFELADGGTLLLDEVSEISPQMQAKLLRVLQERAFERVGSSLTMGIDVRVIATTNRDLRKAIAEKTFREDLYFRLNVLPLNVPPLREREGDVALLARHFVASLCARDARPVMDIDADCLELLADYQWPGNVRELQNICERAVVIASASDSLSGQSGPAPRKITRELIEPWLTPPGRSASALASASSAPSQSRANPAHESLNGHAESFGATIEAKSASQFASESPQLQDAIAGVSVADASGVRTLEDVERELIVRTLRRFDGHRAKTARALDIGIRTLGLKLKKWKDQNLVASDL
ncbi:MAG: sigma-54 dependent transcriptional regulator [Planctomycetota bacterium]|nr:sigma-54 dependent transcriptional regulator [Planctomycetota bacterium]